jgi:hypothetical protein
MHDQFLSPTLNSCIHPQKTLPKSKQPRNWIVGDRVVAFAASEGENVDAERRAGFSFRQ